MFRLWLRVLFASVPVIVILVPAKAGEPIYLALGDSITFGQTDVLPTNHGDQGYVKPFADYLGTAHYGGERPKVLNFAIPGETSGSALTGTPPSGWPWRFVTNNLNYTDPNQSQFSLMQEALAGAKAAGNHVDYVSFGIGANDFQYLFNLPEFQAPNADHFGLMNQSLASVRANYDTLLGALRGEEPDAQLFLLNSHNPYRILGPNDPVTILTEFYSNGLDTIAREEAALFNGTYVDIHTPFVGHEAQYTYIGSGNPHPNSTGYGVIADQLIAASRPPASIPEPSTLVLLATIPLAGLRRRKR